MMKPKTMRKPARVLRKQSCFEHGIVSGTNNPAGLQCVFYDLEDGSVGAAFTGGPLHQGHNGLLHGGFIAAVLDEAMGRSNRNAGVPMEQPVVTAELTTKFIRPIPLGQEMRVYGKVERMDGRKRFTSGEIVDGEGNVMASATALFIVVEQAGSDNPEFYKKVPQYEKINEKDPKIL